ncbi:fumarylacetoacetate hydrolase family protein [Amycolatopsis sp. GM8]|uniref:fumarylacetoacetate hydrolase family protein n=1 Tax=Amycolatopsis sp. GM8 TaxID=2896530 RepID=UPI001F45DE52|nr:fumarylacetoacetate hydrolase family protein [Amycolatopsis sp. GM8]
MRFVTYSSAAGGDRVGVLDGDRVAGLEPGVTLLDLLDRGELIEAGEHALRSPAETVATTDIQLRAPLEPRSIRDCSAFLQHMRNCTGDPNGVLDHRHTQFPVFYFTNPAAVVGPHATVPIAPGSSQFDFELEVCAVIGKAGRNIAVSEAEEYIAGYSILCDWSARDLQLNERPLGLGPAKGKDTATTIGPALVTADELERLRSKKGFALQMTAELNGEPVSEGCWDTIDWTFSDMISYVSRGTVLRPGDVIGSGTVPTGCLYEHHKLGSERFRDWLRPGDEVRLAVEELGELRHRVTAADEIQPLSSGY